MHSLNSGDFENEIISLSTLKYPLKNIFCVTDKNFWIKVLSFCRWFCEDFFRFIDSRYKKRAQFLASRLTLFFQSRYRYLHYRSVNNVITTFRLTIRSIVACYIRSMIMCLRSVSAKFNAFYTYKTAAKFFSFHDHIVKSNKKNTKLRIVFWSRFKANAKLRCIHHPPTRFLPLAKL